MVLGLFCGFYLYIFFAWLVFKSSQGIIMSQGTRARRPGLQPRRSWGILGPFPRENCTTATPEHVLLLKPNPPWDCSSLGRSNWYLGLVWRGFPRLDLSARAGFSWWTGWTSAGSVLQQVCEGETTKTTTTTYFHHHCLVSPGKENKQYLSGADSSSTTLTPTSKEVPKSEFWGIYWAQLGLTADPQHCREGRERVSPGDITKFGAI